MTARSLASNCRRCGHTYNWHASANNCQACGCTAFIDEQAPAAAAGYFDPLTDEVPSYLVAAMNKALTDATHHGKGREGEPVFLAGVRALFSLVVPRKDLDEQAAQYVERQRAEFARHQEEMRVVTRRAREEVAAELVALARARSLLDVRRKTVSMAALQEALDPQG